VVVVDRVGRVARLTLNRPDQLNALDSATIAALERAVADIARDDSVRAVVVAGAGPHFCAGADIAELEQLDGPVQFRAFVGALNVCFRHLQELGKPRWPRYNGIAYGGGLETRPRVRPARGRSRCACRRAGDQTRLLPGPVEPSACRVSSPWRSRSR